MKKIQIRSIILCVVFVLLSCCGCGKSKTIEYDWHLEYLCAPEVWKNNKGEKITVAVVDSGLDYELLGADFDKSRIIATYNSYDDNQDMSDFTSHGTAMLSLIGANGENGFYGVAPNCKFIIVKALNGLGMTNAEALKKGIEFAIENGADIINLSLGSHNENEGVVQVIQYAVSQNIAVVCAAGDQKSEELLFPARIEETLSVAAIDKNNRLYEDSNYGEEIDVFSPGVNIKIPCSSFDEGIIKQEQSGSSVATAIFTGTLALYLSSLSEYHITDVYAYFRQTEYLNCKNFLKR